MNKSTLGKIILTAVVAVGGVGFLYNSMANAERYFKVDTLMGQDLPSLVGKEVKIHGWVDAGSIHENIVAQETHRTFVLEVDGKKIRVFNSGPKPDTFKDRSEVVATGHLVPTAQMKQVAQSLGVAIESDAPYVLDSTELMAKCPSKYDGARINLQPPTPQYK